MSGERSVLFITHADVVMDPEVPVPQWPLSERGLARHAAFNADPAIANVTSIYTSDERKARDGAEILGEHLAITPAVLPGLRENDRSATGYLERDEFERTADAFFANPDESVRGWERASDAQARVVETVDLIVAREESLGDIAVVAHGGVGALLLCHVMNVPISRDADQPAGGGGHLFQFGADSRKLLHGWRRIDPDGSPQVH
ncbi:MAG: histidine phosphatase family protein [Pseudomonadota bacterium]